MTTKPTPTGAAPALLDQVEIFRPGRHVAMSGQVIEFTAADVEAIATAYDPAVHEAPHVVGHPTTDGPAYGWVRALGVNAAGRLCVTSSRQVEPQFAELVGAGRFKKRSASFYPPGHPGNPKPEGYYLKHVGWLGATPPAVKGLADNFAAPEEGLVEFAGWDDEVNAGLWRRMREWFIGQFGADTADKVIPAWDVDTLQREAMRPEPELIPAPNPTTAYAEGAPAVTTATTAADQAAITARQAELDAREAALQSREAAQAALVKQARSAGIAAFCDGLVQQGRLLPAERARIVAFMEGLPDDAEVIEFADGDPAKPVKSPALEVFQAFLKGLPPRVEFSELAHTDRTGATVDLADGNAIAKAALEFVEAEAKAGRTVAIDAAVQHVITTQRKEA
ncbi:peptidase [Pseudaquabacterium pictum]|uniref:Peptidase n=1 Tax=Pseudaquabacterium pictum TaxID=2315236 RepID=A0A480AX02_9BURK|nr:peptidase [Rubrivivax pictus]GCL64325.1 hypothetical protein AQPW35_34060 [Rubrivivax pictus]